MGLPEFRDLCEQLKFSPEQGVIFLGENRVLLSNFALFEVMRRELIESLGLEKARGVLTRMGYSAGYQDAELVGQSIRAGGNAYDVLTAGPALHAIEGWVSVEPVELEIDVAKGHYYAEFIWRESSEAQIHHALYGISTDPVCWIQCGYAAGYGSRFMGRRLLYKEVRCSGAGEHHCTIIGKPVEEWDDPAPEIYYMYPDQLGQKKDLRPTHHLPINPIYEKNEGAALTSFGGMIGSSSAFTQACHLLKCVARTNATVLLLGETGVGKERFARALHEVSERSNGPFVAVNCAAIPNDLLEAELFGVVKGAYSGATNSRKGRFERAHGGTIFLDEIGTLSFSVQAKLLRVLQEREFERLGDEQVRKVDARIIAATNINLQDAVAKGDFRDDLWYRLNVYPIEIPPLRERRDDIPLLLDYFLKTFNQLHSCSVKGFTERAINALLYYSYPGNIRELENIIERAVILVSNDDSIDIPHIFNHEKLKSIRMPLAMRPNGMLEQTIAWDKGRDSNISELVERFMSLGINVGDLENALVSCAVREASGNLSQAARRLGMTRRQLAYRHEKQNL